MNGQMRLGLCIFLILVAGGHSWAIQGTSRQSHVVAVSSTCECCPESTIDTPLTNYQTLFTPSWEGIQSRNPWDSLVPWAPNTKGCDVKVVWEKTHEQDAVERMLGDISQQTGLSVADRLRQSLEEAFVSFTTLAPDSTRSFKARIVATRGSVGTKCPRWHADHVPIRWIQALVGPGCDYVVGERAVDRDLLNGMDDDELTTQQVNKLIVDSEKADIRQGKEGQAVVLVGHENTLHVPAAVHKSPTLLLWQGRVLLTIDVVQED